MFGDSNFSSFYFGLDEAQLFTWKTAAIHFTFFVVKKQKHDGTGVIYRFFMLIVMCMKNTEIIVASSS